VKNKSASFPTGRTYQRARKTPIGPKKTTSATVIQIILTLL